MGGGCRWEICTNSQFLFHTLKTILKSSSFKKKAGGTTYSLDCKQAFGFTHFLSLSFWGIDSAMCTSCLAVLKTNKHWGQRLSGRQEGACTPVPDGLARNYCSVGKCIPSVQPPGPGFWHTKNEIQSWRVQHQVYSDWNCGSHIYFAWL